MKRVFQALVLAVASLLAAQTVLADEPCAAGSCLGDRCADGCCREMGQAPATQMSAACAASRHMAPAESTGSRHRCDGATFERPLQAGSRAEFKGGRASLPLLGAPLQAQSATTAVIARRDGSPASGSEKYRPLLQVFRI